MENLNPGPMDLWEAEEFEVSAHASGRRRSLAQPMRLTSPVLSKTTVLGIGVTLTSLVSKWGVMKPEL